MTVLRGVIIIVVSYDDQVHTTLFTMSEANVNGLDDKGVILSKGKTFLFTTTTRLTLQPNWPIQWALVTPFLTVKWLGSRADHPPPSRITLPYIFMAQCAILHRGHFTTTLLFGMCTDRVKEQSW
jgi:hypothetical protein